MSTAPGPHADEGAPLARAVERFLDRKRGPSIAAKIALVGALGWLVALPTLLGTWAGRALDRRFDSGILWTAAGITLGVSFGSYLLWRSLPGHGGHEP
jgi:ATP synthase protein I